MELTQARAQLAELQEKISAYQHATRMLNYDARTSAPKNTAAHRAHTLSILSAELYHLNTGKETVALLEFLEAHSEVLSLQERRIIEVMPHDVRKMGRFPIDDYVELQKTMVEADVVWRKAKAENDFASFAPYLKKIFDGYRKWAHCCAPDMDPYDFWLNEYEQGLNQERCDEFFSVLQSKIVPLLQKIAQRPQIDCSCILGTIPRNRQEKLSSYLMDLLKLDRGHCGLGVTEHPFTTTLGAHYDVRITTSYKDYSFAPAMFSVMHEGGHAMYGLGVDDSLAYTVLDGGCSTSLHESQSRFYENFLGRSEAFVNHIFPTLQKIFAEQLSGYTAQDVYRAVNRVEPSLIRIEADELTYCLHIMVRYELEKKIFKGQLEIEELPGEWNRLYWEYLGIKVPDDRRGVLQDSHWSHGHIGYFPTYALGSAYAAQMLQEMRKTVDVDACLQNGDLEPIHAWNRAHIWRHGRLYTPTELLERVWNEAFDPTIYTTYLEEKFSKLYGIGE